MNMDGDARPHLIVCLPSARKLRPTDERVKIIINELRIICESGWVGIKYLPGFYRFTGYGNSIFFFEVEN